MCLAYGVFKNRQYGLNVESVAFHPVTKKHGLSPWRKWSIIPNDHDRGNDITGMVTGFK